MRSFRYLLLTVIAISSVFDTTKIHAQSRRVTPAKDTTYFMAPLTEEGHVDYQAALNQTRSQGVTANNNAAIPLSQIFGPSPIPPDVREHYFGNWGIPVPSEEGDYFVNLQSFMWLSVRSELPPAQRAIIESIQEELELATNQPWDEKLCPTVAKWLSKNEHHLAVARDALKRPKYFEPTINLPSERKDLPDFYKGWLPIGDLGQAFSTRFWWMMNQKKYDEAAEDALAVHRVARLIAQKGGTLSLLSGYTHDARAWFYGATLLSQADSTAANRYARGFRQLPPFVSWREQVNLWERLHCIDRVLEEAYKEPSSAIRDRVDWNKILRLVNRFYDRMVACKTENEFQQLLAEYDQISVCIRLKDLFSPPRAPETIAVSLVLQLNPGFQIDVSERSQAARQVTMETALAVRTFYQDKKRRPETLSELVPEYLVSRPTDPFDGNLLRYSRTKGFCLVYSIGRNRVDEKGADWQVSPQGDDYPIRLPLPAPLPETTTELEHATTAPSDGAAHISWMILASVPIGLLLIFGLVVFLRNRT